MKNPFRKPRPFLVRVFEQSRIYGGYYLGSYLPPTGIKLPTDTWLQRRREKVKK